MEERRPAGMLFLSAAVYASIAGFVSERAWDYFESRMNVPLVLTEKSTEKYPWVYSTLGTPAKVRCTLRAVSLESITE